MQLLCSLGRRCRLFVKERWYAVHRRGCCWEQVNEGRWCGRITDILPPESDQGSWWRVWPAHAFVHTHMISTPASQRV